MLLNQCLAISLRPIRQQSVPAAAEATSRDDDQPDDRQQAASVINHSTALSLFEQLIELNHNQSATKATDVSRPASAQDNGRPQRQKQNKQQVDSTRQDCCFARVDFAGFLVPSWLLLSGTYDDLHQIKVRWTRGQLKPVANYTIETIGNIRSINVDYFGISTGQQQHSDEDDPSRRLQARDSSSVDQCSQSLQAIVLRVLEQESGRSSNESISFKQLIDQVCKETNGENSDQNNNNHSSNCQQLSDEVEKILRQLASQTDSNLKLYQQQQQHQDSTKLIELDLGSSGQFQFIGLNQSRQEDQNQDQEQDDRHNNLVDADQTSLKLRKSSLLSNKSKSTTLDSGIASQSSKTSCCWDQTSGQSSAAASTSGSSGCGGDTPASSAAGKAHAPEMLAHTEARLSDRLSRRDHASVMGAGPDAGAADDKPNGHRRRGFSLARSISLVRQRRPRDPSPTTAARADNDDDDDLEDELNGGRDRGRRRGGRQPRAASLSRSRSARRQATVWACAGRPQVDTSELDSDSDDLDGPTAGANVQRGRQQPAAGRRQATIDYLATDGQQVVRSQAQHKRTFSMRGHSLVAFGRELNSLGLASAQAGGGGQAGGVSRLALFLRKLFHLKRRCNTATTTSQQIDASIEQQLTSRATDHCPRQHHHHHHHHHLVGRQPHRGSEHQDYHHKCNCLHSTDGANRLVIVDGGRSRSATRQTQATTISGNNNTTKTNQPLGSPTRSPSSHSQSNSSLIEILDCSPSRDLGVAPSRSRSMREPNRRPHLQLVQQVPGATATAATTTRATGAAHHLKRSSSNVSCRSNGSCSTTKSTASQQLRKHLDEAYKRHRECRSRSEREFMDSINVLRQASRHALQCSRSSSKSRQAKSSTLGASSCSSSASSTSSGSSSASSASSAAADCGPTSPPQLLPLPPSYAGHQHQQQQQEDSKSDSNYMVERTRARGPINAPDNYDITLEETSGKPLHLGNCFQGPAGHNTLCQLVCCPAASQAAPAPPPCCLAAAAALFSAPPPLPLPLPLQMPLSRPKCHEVSEQQQQHPPMTPPPPPPPFSPTPADLPDLRCPIWRSMLLSYYHSQPPAGPFGGPLPPPPPLFNTNTSQQQPDLDAIILPPPTAAPTAPTESPINGGPQQQVGLLAESYHQHHHQHTTSSRQQQQHNTTIDLKIEIEARDFNRGRRSIGGSGAGSNSGRLLRLSSSKRLAAAAAAMAETRPKSHDQVEAEEDSLESMASSTSATTTTTEDEQPAAMQYLGRPTSRHSLVSSSPQLQSPLLAASEKIRLMVDSNSSSSNNNNNNNNDDDNDGDRAGSMQRRKPIADRHSGRAAAVESRDESGDWQAKRSPGDEEDSLDGLAPGGLGGLQAT